MSGGDDSGSTGPKQSPDSSPDQAEGVSPTGWLDALNSFLDRALKADIDTGC